MTKNRARITTIIALFLSLLIGAVWLTREQPDTGNSSASAAGVKELVMRQSYPGASFAIEFDYNNAYFGQADHGDVQLSSDALTFIYVAPLDVQTDVYRILNTSDGEPIAKGKVQLTMPPPMPLIVSELEPGKSVAARYGDIFIEATFENGMVTAQYHTGSEDEAVEVEFVDRNATMTWRTVKLDGYGALSPEESDALQEIATGPMSRALTMVPLDLGCIDKPFDIPAEIYAALLFPWQMILKYEVTRREPVVRHFLAASQCAFPGHLAPQPEKPQNIAVLWDADHSVPSIYDAFPFDGDGQYTALPQ